MNILLISFYFPPFHAVGALRVSKTAKYLTQMQHQVKVLAAADQPLMDDLQVEIDENNIIRVPYFDINAPVQFLLGGKKSVAVKGYERAGSLPKIVRALGYLYKDLVNIPDGQIGWYSNAVKAGQALLKNWKPDFILASSPPLTSFLVARKLSKLFDIPWIADFRDLWADNYNADLYQSVFRRFIDRKIEKQVVSTASALITVSEPLEDVLRDRFDKKVGVVMNGYDLNDYPSVLKQETKTSKIKIIYTGTIYPIKKDPTPLFEALVLLGEEAKNIEVDFYGRNNKIIQEMAEKYQVSHLVNCYETVRYQESLAHQVNADLLLLLIFNSPKEKGVMTAKFFEYLGARKPILLIGCVDGLAASIIKKRQLGFAENDPKKIAQILRKCISEKECGEVPHIALEAIKGFSRQEQVERLMEFLKEIKS